MKKVRHGETTIDYVPPVSWHQWFKAFLICALVIIIAMTTGCMIGRFGWPKEIFLEKEKIVYVPLKNDHPEKPWLVQKKIDEDAKQMAKEEVRAMLENCVGVLEIKDNEAQTVRYKKAAIASKEGFSDLKKGVPYIVHSYFLHKEIGYGVVSDDQKTLFLLKWLPGTTKAPTINPAKITISAGRRIEILGKSK